MNIPERPSGQIHVSTLRGRRGVLRLTGRIVTGTATLEGARLQLTGRDTDSRCEQDLELEDDPSRTRDGHRYRYRLTLPWTQLWAHGRTPVSDILDAWVLLDLGGHPEPVRVRVGMTPFLARKLTRPTWVEQGDTAVAITPYYTTKANNTSFRVEVFTAEALRYLHRRLRTRHLDRLRHRRARPKPIWLVGEQPHKAQDTGVALFRHLRRNHPEIDAYYVMDTASPKYANVAELGNVVDHRSKEHVRLSLLADRIVGSHHPDFLYPTRSPRFRRAVRAPRVFLQHGVMGIKPMADLYGKNAGDFETDVFVVSSEREKAYVVDDFGYHPDEVAVTGLTRFDTLFADDVPVRQQILIMPTWRAWLPDGPAYLTSDHHARWSGLLHNPRLREVVERHGLEVVFCAHPKMQPFAHLYADTPARLLDQGEADVQFLLKQSAVLVTDFSSVGFDFAFLGRPVVYFQYDRARALGETGAHIDLDTELPGEVAFTTDQVIDQLGRLAETGLVPPEALRTRAERFLVARDGNSSERVYAATMAARRRAWPPRGGLKGQLPQGFYRKWRRSRFYFPSMRLLMWVLRRFPADADRIVFEAGLGRQYADSPRYIYEELVRRGHPGRKVWSYRGTVHSDDARTSTVERLSVRYFWHLARAKYWVSSQNMPYYVTRRRDGVFVQTWHGTPVKRMLRDVAEVYGRDEGYVGRMTRAAAQWTVLVSPSAFATGAISGAYGFTGPVLEVGYPRNDLLAAPGRDERAAAVRARLGIPADARVVLYAPTFRDDRAYGRGRFGFALPFDPARLTQRLGRDVVVLLRLHLLVSDELEIPEAIEGTVRDVSAYPEIQDLQLASDVLVTDYSSVLFDYAILRRPMVFHAYDLEDYRDRLRGFYLDYEREVPGPITTTEDELLDVLARVVADPQAARAQWAERLDAFVARFAPHDDGGATARVVDAVFGPPR